MSEETFETVTENLNRIPMRERNAFQGLFMQLMLGEKPIDKTKEEWNKEKAKWLETYGKTISDIIDNPKNKDIRDLIMQGRHKEASEIVIKMLEGEGIKIAA